MTDLAAIRARHDVFETYLQQMPHHAAAVTLDLRVRTLHADRGVLLAALDANDYVLQIAREEAKTNLEAKNYWEERADAAQAALDRVAKAMAEHGP